MTKKTEKKMGNAKKAGLIGAGVAALAAGAGVAYFLTTHPKVVKKATTGVEKWAHKTHREILSQMKKAKHLSRVDYKKLVDMTVKKYAKTYKVAAPEVAKLVKQLQASWDVLEKEVKKEKEK